MPSSRTAGAPVPLPLTARLAVAGIALIGLIGVVPVSLAELSSSGACPHLGPLPACHLVTLAYGAILASAVFLHRWWRALFLVGWLPVFGLAAIGTALELTGHEACPKTDGGWPKCYFSLALACAAIAPVLLYRMFSHRAGVT